MPSSKDIKEILEARKTRRAIPQVDPADVVARPALGGAAPALPEQGIDTRPSDAEIPELAIEEPPQLETGTLENTGAPERESVGAGEAPATVGRPAVLTPVDTSEKPFNRGFHMYPSRHEQLLDLAYVERRKPWEIIDQALAEYVKRHHGGKAGK